ncbi:hypothetical protein [Shewanella phaeophyticola]|uniref:Bacterial Ig-like domain-containing protein n=1 Tax=Shewanella phaeophyticola TaxID=2978345 RepID=A0ABT2P7M5_9GAMM|nr:hypothetical protein [Shewanella sp. KJ10-1]MCT8988648.1 hypothetical protein [Shewanella sp. KJ10-1]
MAVNADGSYAVDNVDISALVDGEITVVATASDSNGNPLTANDAEELDATAGNITVDLILITRMIKLTSLEPAKIFRLAARLI